MVLVPPTLVASIYGMNFKNMPELEWSWGYPASIVVMIAIDVWLWFKFKKVGWL